MSKGLCNYVNQAGLCTILRGVYCTEYKSICKFHKTEQEHNDELNKAIRANRAKGNCANCKYREKQCSMIGMEE